MMTVKHVHCMRRPRGSTNFPKIQEPPQNSRRHKY